MSDSYDAMRLARAYAKLGDAVGSQIDSVVEADGDARELDRLVEEGELNPNAVQLAADRHFFQVLDTVTGGEENWAERIDAWLLPEVARLPEVSR